MEFSSNMRKLKNFTVILKSFSSSFDFANVASTIAGKLALNFCVHNNLQRKLVETETNYAKATMKIKSKKIMKKYIFLVHTVA